MCQESGVIRALHGGQTQQAGVVSQIREQLCLAHGLCRLSADSADPEQRLGPRAVGAVHFLRGQFQHRRKQPNPRLADGELRRVHADSQAAGARGDVIPRQRALASLVETAVRGEREGVRGDDGASREHLPSLVIQLCHDERPRFGFSDSC